MQWQSRCADFTRLSNTTMIKKNIWSFGETQKYLNLYWEATLRFRKKRQPYHKQKGSCIHFRNFYFHNCIIPKNTFPFGWSLRDNRKEPLRGILLYIVYYREYSPPPKKKKNWKINFAGMPVDGVPSLSNFIAWLKYEKLHDSVSLYHSEIWTSFKVRLFIMKSGPLYKQLYGSWNMLTTAKNYGVYESLHV